MLSSIEWTDQYKTGIAWIDKQHLQLIDTVNKLIEVPNGVDEAQHVEDTIFEMLGYAMYHLRDEEAFLTKHKYPDLPAHKAEHSGFIVRLNGWASTQDTLPNRQELAEYLVTWINEHIFNADMAYKRYLEKSGLDLSML